MTTKISRTLTILWLLEATSAVAQSPSATASASDVEELRQEVKALTETVKTLQQQVKDQQAQIEKGTVVPAAVEPSPIAGAAATPVTRPSRP